MAIGDVYRLSAIGQWGGSNTAIVTCHVKMASVGGTPALAADEWAGYLLNNYAGNMATTWSWVQINYLSRNLTPEVSGTRVPATWPYAGLDANDSLPYQACTVVTLRTAYAGRSYRGRLFLPAMGEDKQAATVIAGGTVTQIQTWINSWIAGWGSGGTSPDYRLVVRSDKLAVTTEVTSGLVRNLIASQRRRRPGVGV